MNKINVQPVPQPQEPGAVQGACSCGQVGPETTSEENAKLWGVGHGDGHKAVSKT